MGRVEDTAAVGESTILAWNINKCHGFEVEGADNANGLSDLLPIGADILNGRAPDRAGDTGEALDTADLLLTDGENKSIPLHPCGYCVESHIAVDGDIRRPSDGYVKHEAIKATIVDQQVTATTKRKEPKSAFEGKVYGLQQGRLAGDLSEVAGRAANFERGIGSERNILPDVYGGARHGSEIIIGLFIAVVRTGRLCAKAVEHEAVTPAMPF
jgi:hypothetical protein